MGGLGLPELKDPELGAKEGRRGMEDVDEDELQEDAGDVDLRPDRDPPLTADPNAIGRDGVGLPLVVDVTVVDEVDVAVAAEVVVVVVVVALDLVTEGGLELRPSLVGLGGPGFSLTTVKGAGTRVDFFSRRGVGAVAAGVLVCALVTTLERSAELLAERRYFNPRMF